MNKTTIFGAKMESKIVRAVATTLGSKNSPDQHPSQGIATLLVMIVVLIIIVMFCCFSAPGIRALCKKYILCRCCRNKRTTTSSEPENGTPTVIFLPHGRYLVVDRAVFSQLKADQSGIDFLQLSASLISQHRVSILDNSKPPAYEEIVLDLPPPYTEVFFKETV